MAGRKPVVPGHVLTPAQKQQRYRDARAYSDMVAKQFAAHLQARGIDSIQFMLDVMDGRASVLPRS